MKKIIIFLITILCINIGTLINVNAQNNLSFYEGDYIQGIWMTKQKGGIKYYQKARFFMSQNHQFAYCIEPFAMFNENSAYQSSLTASNLSHEQMKRITLLSYFGYGYGNHLDQKWYAITQFMIWQASDPSGDYYFTDGLNGNRITAYTNEMNEINTLIQEYLTLPSISNTEIQLVEGKTALLHDTNNVLHHYTSDHPNVHIEGNTLKIEHLSEGSYTVNLTRDSSRLNNVPLFYLSNDSQDMHIYGDIDRISTQIKINVEKTSLDIIKIDSDTKTTTPSGEASLKGAIYQLYDHDMNELAKLEIGEDMTSTIENLDYGKYYLKELSAGIGYEIDPKIYEFVIDHLHPNIELILENKVIKKEIIIHKLFGDGVNHKQEAGINFNIFDRNNQLVTTITTNEFGYASITLPFGTYKISQINTTDGYQFTDDFHIHIIDDHKEEIQLYDYKIKVPNTSKNTPNLLILMIIWLTHAYYASYPIIY